MSADQVRDPELLSTPVYAESLRVRHVAHGRLAGTARAVARHQAAAGWTADLGEAAECDVLVFWGRVPRATDIVGAGSVVVVLDEAAGPAWLATRRSLRGVNVVLLPPRQLQRWLRWGPVVPLAPLPAHLADAVGAGQMSAWIARAYAFGG
ncbi:hypothetical protein [Klenkia taihuensis]|uniref:Uncharacterized protein n=1 Tax=Klenkia taihuensis TaxID=1225127 RepID=A0A1I1NQD7_9ACTN|nr:hypothetical protein [Klenkia taihuensis]GHE11795.1 hypothetical protein GCM10011381_26790 [Klenkia taihuensis]SFC99492.1 hypothetical protein SAMN05661030_2213 [Klenkia taihuensis]